MAISDLTVFSTSLLLLLLLLTTTLSEAATANAASTATYIIRTRSDLKPSAFPSLHDWYSSSLTPSSNILHIYKNAFHGFSAVLTEAQASLLRAEPFVLSVFPDRARRLHTTQSSRFLGLLSSNSHLLADSHYGDDVIIAVLDSGIDPKHRSFGDVGLGPVPPRWSGACQTGPRFPAGSCNRKLVGARFFASGFKAASGLDNSTVEVLSPYDSDGHGTHTASTAAGRPSRNASLFGHASGTASGVAPRARLAVYKVCWSAGCFNSDILAAIDDAVSDGADVISLSLGAGPVPYHLDPIAVAAFAAAAKGVVVSASAGNDGPGEMTATNIAPWIATVGAGSIDRSFPADVVLGDGTVVAGVSIHIGSTSDAYFPLVYAGNVSTSRVGYHSSAPFCMPGSLDPDLTRGKVVLCERGAVPRAEKGLAVREAGGAGMIVANQMIDGQGLVPDAHLLPAIAVGATEGFMVRAYIDSQNERARVRFVFHGTRLGVKPAPVVASFSGRGPNAISDYIMKPDLIAPGVGILAAWTDNAGPTGLSADTRRTQFNVLSGTSMACPHVSGIAALLKGAHPEWSPAAIKSAMMTSARITDNLGREISDESSGNSSAGWVVGSGQVDPEKAVSPGLVYDLTADDYVAFLCSSNYTRMDIRTITRRAANCSGINAPWDLNYPSISVVLEQSEGAGKLEVTVRRTVRNVGGSGTAEYNVDVKSPAGSVVTVEPSKLVFVERGAKLAFAAKISAERRGGLTMGGSSTEFGSITWRDGKHVVRSPVAVTWREHY